MNKDKPNEADKMMESIRAVIRHHPKLEATYLLSCIVMFDEFKKPDSCQEIILEGLKAFPKAGVYQHYRLTSIFSYSMSLPRLLVFSHGFFKKKKLLLGSRVVDKLLKKRNISKDDLEKSINILESDPHHLSPSRI